jgi:type II secretory pathway predicted ATPase ExeA
MTRWAAELGLKTAPFDKDIEAANLWLSSSRKAVLDPMLEALHERSHILLTGEPGIGKTCLLRALRRSLPDSQFRLTYTHNATLGRRDFYRQLSMTLGLTPHATAAAVFFQISMQFEELSQDRVHPVLLLDEAHLLHQDVLDHLHVLTNFNWDQKPLLSLLLVGLPELHQRLVLSRNRSLYSRIHTRIVLPDAKPEDTAEYIDARLKHAGAKRPLFSSDAITLMHEASAGRLRDIDRLATNSLKRAAARKLTIVDRDIVERIIAKDAGQPCDAAP